MIVGREAETAALNEFAAVDGSARAMLVSGPPGIGKTTLWEAGIVAARERGNRVLVARASDAETDLAFAALSDLLDEVGEEELAGLPAPQRHALEVALLRSEPEGAPPGARAIATGLLGALRELAARGPLLVAIDDLQWIDAPSAQALAFAARRPAGGPVRFLLAARAQGGVTTPLLRSLGAVEPLEIGPLSLGATRALLSERLGLTLTRRVLRTLCDAAGGNPLFALELGRSLRERGLPEIGEELRLPDAVEDLFAPRVERLDAPQRALLLAAALDPNIGLGQLGELASAAVVEDAIAAGLLVAERDRVRPAHPLLAAAARRQSRAEDRRRLHRELARVAGGAERRARHLALATELPDADVAATVAAAAAAAAARGAAEDAVTLGEHALRLTPAQAAERPDRVLALAEYLVIVGESERVSDVLEPEVGALPAGEPRVRAHMLLADGGDVQGVADYERQLDLALAASGGDPVLRSPALAGKAESLAVARVERIADAEALALEADTATDRAGADVERRVLHSLAWARVMRGRPVGDLNERYRSASHAADDLYRSVERAAAVRLGWRGEIVGARARLHALMALADDRGQAFSYVVMRLNLCELELRAGDCLAAGRLLDEWDQTADGELLVGAGNERCRALLAAVRGDGEEAERWATAALAGAEPTGMRWDRLEALRAQGIAALVARAPESAAERLGVVWEHTQREGVGDPGAFPVAPDLVEALVESGRPGEAAAVAERLAAMAQDTEHPWGLIGARRCRALIRFAEGDDVDAAAAALRQAAADYERLGLRFDHARSLLAVGRALRRLRRWGAARDALVQAAAVFDGSGSPGWAAQVRDEASRLGARRPRPANELTPTEQRVAELAASGLANKEIASILVVTVSTIEAHLSHAYAKLGVRSRVQLAARLATGIPKD